jgi:hypothetical protein
MMPDFLWSPPSARAVAPLGSTIGVGGGYLGIPSAVGLELNNSTRWLDFRGALQVVYRRYAIAAEADLREGVAKLAKLHESQAGAVSLSRPPEWRGKSASSSRT